MTIQERIDALTEEEAKDALFWLIGSTITDCCLCPYVYYCAKKPVLEGTEKCKNLRLDKVLKEAQQ